MEKKHTLGKIKEVKNKKEGLLDNSINQIKDSIISETEFETELNEFGKELSHIEQLEKDTDEHFLDKILNKPNEIIQMTETEKKKIEKEALSLPGKSKDFIIRDQKMHELRNELSELESFISKQLGSSSTPNNTKDINFDALNQHKSTVDAFARPKLDLKLPNKPSINIKVPIKPKK